MRKFNITVNGEVYEVEVEELGIDGVPIPVKSSRPVAKPAVSVTPVAKKPAPKAEKKAPVVSAGSTTITAPMPGVILDVRVAEGQSVNKNDIILVLEAMKMENEVMAPQDGIIDSIAVKKGSNVNAGDIMIVIK